MQYRCKNCGKVIEVRSFWLASDRCPECSTRLNFGCLEVVISLIAIVGAFYTAFKSFGLTVRLYRWLTGNPNGGSVLAIVIAVLLIVSLLPVYNAGLCYFIPNRFKPSEIIEHNQRKEVPRKWLWVGLLPFSFYLGFQLFLARAMIDRTELITIVVIYLTWYAGAVWAMTSCSSERELENRE